MEREQYDVGAIKNISGREAVKSEKPISRIGNDFEFMGFFLSSK